MPAVYESGGVSPAAGPDAGGAGGATSTPAQAYTAASHDPELANWVSGGSSTPTSSAPVQGAGGHVDSELGNWLSGGSSATAPADPQANQAGNQSSGWQNPLQAIGSLFSTMFSKPGQAIRSAAKAIEGDVQSGGKEFFTGVVPDAWRAAGRGFRGEENVSGRDLLPANAPTLFPAIHPLYGTPTGWGGAQKPVDWIYNHISKPVGGLGVELVSDPWMWSGAAGAKAIGGAAKAAGAFALGSPEALGAIEAFGGPAAQLLKTSKPILAGQSVLRNLAGQFSIDAALSHLPQGSEVTQAIREFMGGKSVGAVENEGRLAANLAPGLANATPEEKATFLYIKDSLAATEAQAKVARETAATAEEAQKQAVLNYKAPGPFDGSADIANQAGLAQRAGAALPGPEFSAIQNVAQGAGQTPEEALQDIAKRAYGHAPDVALNPGQRGQIVRAFGNAQNLDEGYTNLADLIRSEGTHGPGEFGTAVRNKAAMDPAGADPFNMSLEQRHQSATDDLANLVREHKWNSDKYDFNVNQLARGAAKDINLANGDARNQLWQEILSHGKIRPGSGSAGAELTRGLPSFLKDAKGGMGLDELASSMRGGMSEQDLVNEIMGVSGKQPVTATSSQAIKEAEQRFLSTPEGQKLRDTLSAHSQQMDALREELGPLQQALSAKRGPFDDLPAGEFPRPSWSQIEAPATTTGGQLAAQGAGQTTGPVDVEKAVLQAVQNRKSTLLTVELVDGSQMDLHFMAPYDSARHELIDHAGNAVDPKLVRKLIDRGTGQVLVDATAPAATSFASGGLSEAANAVVQDALRNNGGDKAAAVTDLLEHLKAMGKMTGDPEIPAQMNTWREAVTHLGGTPPAETPQLTADHLRQWLDNPQNLDQAATRNMEAYGWKDKPGSPFWTKERDGIEHILRNEVLPGVEAGNTQAWRVRLGPGGSVGDMVGESLASQAKGAAGAGAQATSGINPNAIPEQYRHLVEPVMQKYGHLLPEFQKLTDESYAKARGFLPDLGYQEHYVPRISRAGAADANPLTKLYNRLTEDAAAIPTKEGQMAGALSTKPGFANERTLPTFDAFARDAASRGRHAVLDPVDALLTHMNQSTHAEQSMKLRDELLSMGDGIAVKFENYRDIPPGFKDMSNVPGWDKIAVEKKVGKVLEDVLLPKERGPAGILYDTMADRIKGATFYNPLVHGKNLGYRAVMEGQNPLLSAATRAEVKEFGPTLRNLIEHG
ncbi:MAG: hypothetical protein JWN15_3796, partial [Firmicutes bacterium]|nr:hypothetical protein [Bacillota bacterium]